MISPYVYYSNAGAAEMNDADTWNADYGVVYHLREDPLPARRHRRRTAPPMPCTAPMMLPGATVEDHTQMSDTQPIDLNAAALGIGRHVSGIADPFNGHIDAFRIAHIQRSDGWIETTWNNMSDPGAFAVAGVEPQQGSEPPPLAGAGVVVCLMA